MKNNKSLGQHWLKNRAILDEIADLAAGSSMREKGDESDGSMVRPAEGTVVADGATAENCLEIGPGLGTLTSSLLKRYQKVTAVEFDPQLAANLPKSFPGKNLEVVQGDILQVDIASLVQAPYDVVGNIPYYITSPIVRTLLEVEPRPRRIVLLMQKEVAERIAAENGRQSLLSLQVQNLAEAELGPVVKAAEFTPPPKVDSQVIILTPLAESQVPNEALRLAARGFSNPRKKLVSNLADGRISKEGWEKILQDCKINPNARAESLGLWDWEELASHF